MRKLASFNFWSALVNEILVVTWFQSCLVNEILEWLLPGFSHV